MHVWAQKISFRHDTLAEGSAKIFCCFSLSCLVAILCCFKVNLTAGGKCYKLKWGNVVLSEGATWKAECDPGEPPGNTRACCDHHSGSNGATIGGPWGDFWWWNVVIRKRGGRKAHTTELTCKETGVSLLRSGANDGKNFMCYLLGDWNLAKPFKFF